MRRFISNLAWQHFLMNTQHAIRTNIIKDRHFIENVMLNITSAFFEKGRGNQSQLNNGVFGETTLAADQGNLKIYLVMLRCLELRLPLVWHTLPRPFSKKAEVILCKITKYYLYIFKNSLIYYLGLFRKRPR
jgi:hypothetical protein